MSTPSRAGLPPKIVAGYWNMWEGPKVSDITAEAPQYNLIYAAFATSASGGADGRVIFEPTFQSSSSLRDDIAASQAVGTTWLLSVGGGDEPIRLMDSGNVDEMVHTLIPIINAYRFDGVDFDLECGPQCWNVTSMKAVAKRLKDHYGQQFVISAAPRPHEDCYRTWAVQMGDLLDLFGYQFYDDLEFNDADVLRDTISYRVDQAVQLGIPASKILLGAITHSSFSGGHNTPQVYAEIFRSEQKSHPTLRGAFVWDTYYDHRDGWIFASALGPVVRGQ